MPLHSTVLDCSRTIDKPLFCLIPAQTNPDQKTFTVYDITPKGRRSYSEETAIVLPVPVSLREVEQIEEERRAKRTLSQTGHAGMQQPDTTIPRTTAFGKWQSYLGVLRKRGDAQRIRELCTLLERIDAWRSDMASRYRMAPAAVMEEHLSIKIAYATATLPLGVSGMDRGALKSAGVRHAGLDDLVKVLSDWTVETNGKEVGTEQEPHFSGDTGGSGAMVFAGDGYYRPLSEWRHAVYKPNRSTGKAVWESSYERVVAGEHVQTIAINPANGRPIQVATVVGHVLDGLVLGKPVPLVRLARAIVPPTRKQWEELQKCEELTGMDCAGDPATSGANGEVFRMSDFLLPLMGAAFAMKDPKDRTEEERAKFSSWCEKLRYYMAFRRSQYIPVFENT